MYKNYVPLCAVLIGIVGLGIYMFRGGVRQLPRKMTEVKSSKVNEDIDPLK